MDKCKQILETIKHTHSRALSLSLFIYSSISENLEQFNYLDSRFMSLVITPHLWKHSSFHYAWLGRPQFLDDIVKLTNGMFLIQKEETASYLIILPKSGLLQFNLCNNKFNEAYVMMLPNIYIYIYSSLDSCEKKTRGKST